MGYLHGNHGLLCRNYGLLSRNHGLTSRNCGLISRNCGLISRNCGLISRNYGLLSRNYGLLSMISLTRNQKALIRLPEELLDIWRTSGLRRHRIGIWSSRHHTMPRSVEKYEAFTISPGRPGTAPWNSPACRSKASISRVESSQRSCRA